MKPKLPDFRNMIKRQHIPVWLDIKVVLILVLLALFLMAMSWSVPQEPADKVTGLAQARNIPAYANTPTHSAETDVDTTATVTNTPVPPGPTPVVTRTPTPIPEEWNRNPELANGLILGAVVLVLIIVGGTLWAIRRR